MANATILDPKLSSFASIDKSMLISRPQWGDINFSAATESIDGIFELAALLQDLPLDRLPSNAINSISNALESALHWINRNNNFTLQQGAPTQVRDEIVNNLASQQQALYNETHNWIPFLAYLKGDIPKQLSRITSSVVHAEQQNSTFEGFLTAKRQEIDQVVSATREAAAEAGVGVFTQDFLEDAKHRDADAKYWLTRTTAIAGTTLFLALVSLLYQIPSGTGTAEAIHFSTSKVVVLAILLGITAWCAGNYKANKHLATTARFKAHALRTFQAFVQASDDEDTKNAVLLETTRAIFAQPSSGYLKGEASIEGTSRILEIVKGSSHSA